MEKLSLLAATVAYTVDEASAALAPRYTSLAGRSKGGSQDTYVGGLAPSADRADTVSLALHSGYNAPFGGRDITVARFSDGSLEDSLTVGGDGDDVLDGGLHEYPGDADLQGYGGSNSSSTTGMDACVFTFNNDPLIQLGNQCWELTGDQAFAQSLLLSDGSSIVSIKSEDQTLFIGRIQANLNRFSWILKSDTPISRFSISPDESRITLVGTDSGGNAIYTQIDANGGSQVLSQGLAHADGGKLQMHDSVTQDDGSVALLVQNDSAELGFVQCNGATVSSSKRLLILDNPSIYSRMHWTSTGDYAISAGADVFFWNPYDPLPNPIQRYRVSSFGSTNIDRFPFICTASDGALVAAGDSNPASPSSSSQYAGLVAKYSPSDSEPDCYNSEQAAPDNADMPVIMQEASWLLTDASSEFGRSEERMLDDTGAALDALLGCLSLDDYTTHKGATTAASTRGRSSRAQQVSNPVTMGTGLGESPPSQGSQGTDLSAGAIAGIVIGILLGLGLIGLLSWVLVCRNRNKIMMAQVVDPATVRSRGPVPVAAVVSGPPSAVARSRRDGGGGDGGGGNDNTGKE